VASRGLNGADPLRFTLERSAPDHTGPAEAPTVEPYPLFLRATIRAGVAQLLRGITVGHRLFRVVAEAIAVFHPDGS